METGTVETVANGTSIAQRLHALERKIDALAPELQAMRDSLVEIRRALGTEDGR